MPNWKHSIRVGDLHEMYEEDLLSIQDVASQLADRLETTPYKDDLDDQIDMLRHGIDDVEDYDAVLSEIYDFGDDDHKLWLDPT